MPVDAAERRRRGAGAADAGARRPRNTEVEGVQRSAACAQAAGPRGDARGASAREALQQAVAGVNAMAGGASGQASAAALGSSYGLGVSCLVPPMEWKQTSCDGWLVGDSARNSG
jgi:hypothetical protein